MTRICFNFQVSNENRQRIREWLHNEVYPPIVEEQRKTLKDPHPMMIDMWNEGYPYEGAIGGGLTYEFIPTSVGTIFKVKYKDRELDLTDYDMW